MPRISTFLAGLFVAGAVAAGALPSSASLAILHSSDRIDVHLAVISSDATLPDRWMELRQVLGGAFDVRANRVDGQLSSVRQRWD